MLRIELQNIRFNQFFIQQLISNFKNSNQQMSIQSTQKITSSIYQEGTRNPKKNKNKNKTGKTKPSTLKSQIHIDQQRCHKENNLLSVEPNKINENLQINQFLSSKTQLESFEKKDQLRNGLYQKDDKMNLHLESNRIERRESQNTNILVNSIPPPFNQKKEPQKVEKTLTQQQNEDNLNSRHELAIQGNANLLTLVNQDNRITRVENLANTSDQKLTQRKRYSKDQNFIQNKIFQGQNKLNKWKFKTVVPNSFSYRAETSFPKLQKENTDLEIIELKQLTYISFNICAMDDLKANQINKKFGILEGDRIRQIMQKILRRMKEGVHVISLQEICSQLSRKQLLELIKTFNNQSKWQYHYPGNLQRMQKFQTTMILTRLQGQFSQFAFSIQNKDLSQQAFFIFPAKINGKQESVCLFNSHLISSRGNNTKQIINIRLRQMDQIKALKQKLKMRFFCIGDMNIGGTSDYIAENQHAKEIFYDAVNYIPPQTRQTRGSFLFEAKNGKVFDQKLDRVWVDKENAKKTFVQIRYVDHLLYQYEGQIYKREDMISKVNGMIQFKTISDHSMLYITITFTK